MSGESFTDLADSLAGDLTDVITAKQQGSITPVNSDGVNKPTVASPGTINWKSPWVLGAAALAAGLTLLAVFRPRRR